MISYEEFLEYEPRTGVLWWKPRSLKYFKNEHGWKIWNSRYAGKPAGSKVTGYIYVRLFGKNYAAHHIAYYLQTGEYVKPPFEIDHKNRIRDDNRWDNLRRVTKLQNAMNKEPPKSGIRGVAWDKSKEAWVVRFSGRKVGSRVVLLDAVALRMRYEREYEVEAKRLLDLLPSPC